MKRLMSLIMAISLSAALLSVQPAVTFASGIAAITGDDIVTRAGNGKTTVNMYSFTVDGVSAEADWSLTEPAEGVIMLSSGALVLEGIVTGNDVLVTISASAKDNPSLTATKKVSITRYIYYEDFESVQVGEVPQAGSITNGGIATVQIDETGNKYRKASGEWSNSNAQLAYPSANFLFSSSVGTFEGKYRLDNDSESGPAFNMPFRNIGTNDTAFALYIRLVKNTNGKVDITSSYNANGEMKTVTIAENAADVGEWFSIRLTADFANKVYSVFVNNVLCADRYRACNPDYFKRFSGYCKLGVPHDELTFYSGYSPFIKLSPPKPEIIIPAIGRSVKVPLLAVLDGITPLSDVTWSLADSYTGVSVDSQTGMLIVTGNAGEGLVKVNANSGTISSEITIMLFKYAWDYENDITGTWESNYSAPQPAILSDTNGNEFLRLDINKEDEIPNVRGDLRMEIPAKLQSGKTVIQMKVRPQDSTDAIGKISFNLKASPTNPNFNSSDWAIFHTLNISDNSGVFNGNVQGHNTPVIKFNADEWHDYKLIIDTEQARVTAFFDGALSGIGSYPYNNYNEGMKGTYINKLILARLDIDDLIIYQLTDEVPIANCLSIADPCAGSLLTADYNYYDVNGDEEDCSIIKWFLSDSVDGSYIEVGTGKTYQTSLADAGKFIKFTVLPANQNGMVTGSEVSGKPVKLLLISITKPVIKFAGTQAIEPYKIYMTASEQIISAESTVTNKDSKDCNFALLIACYQDGNMVNVSMHRDNIAGGESKTFSPSIIKADGISNATVKVFGWNMDILIPLFETIIQY